MTFGAVTYDGMIRIVDVVKLRSAIAEGLGPGKAYGHGLLSVAHMGADPLDRYRELPIDTSPAYLLSSRLLPLRLEDNLLKLLENSRVVRL